MYNEWVYCYSCRCLYSRQLHLVIHTPAVRSTEDKEGYPANVRGFVHGDKIKIFGRLINTSTKDINSTYKSWTTSLKKLKELPQWSEITWPQAPSTKLLTIQQCQDYVIYFYSNGEIKVQHSM